MITKENQVATIPADLWYLCLDYSQAEALSEARYLQMQDALKGSHSGVGSQRVLINGHIYLAILAIDVSPWAKTRFTHMMLDFHTRDRVAFVRLPPSLLSIMMDKQEELKEKISRSGKSFVSAHEIDEREVDWEPEKIEDIAPPVLEDEKSSAPRSASKQHTGGGMPSSAHTKKRSLLERYYTARRLRAENSLAQLRRLGATSQELRTATVVERAMLLAAQRTRYYEFAPSALALVSHLMQDGEKGSETHIAQLPEMHVFVRFAGAIDLGVYAPVQGLFFADPLRSFMDLVAQDASVRPVFSADLERRQEAGGLPRTLTLLREDGEIILAILYDAARGLWHLSDLHVCPDHACVKTQEKPAIWQPCSSCQKFLDYFSRWLPIALLALAGEFASEPEPVLREQEEEITYKQQRPGSGRYDEKRQRTRWQIVTFDASVRRRQPARHDVPERDEATRSTWLDLAVEKGTVLYVNRRIGQTTRKLDPKRNARWKYAREVTVKAHPRRVPMSVERLSRLITRVVSSREEKE
jgi:hypothetical protein